MDYFDLLNTMPWLTCLGLIIMVVFVIFVGAFRSVKRHDKSKKSADTPEIMTRKNAVFLPLFMSVHLLVLYNFASQEDTKLHTAKLLFFIILIDILSPLISSLVPDAIPSIQFNFKIIREHKFSSHDVVGFVLSYIIGAWYWSQKHWIADNIFGIIFAICAIERLFLNDAINGCILMFQLFVYDIWFVFGTNVMSTVAESVDIPVKLVFPQDILENGLYATNFSMIGLGDIVIPGVFIAFLLRFENSLKRNSKMYFYVTFAAYILSLVTCMIVCHVFSYGQPALMYIVPACLITPFTLALFKADINVMFQYRDYPQETRAELKAEESRTETDKDK